MKDDEKTFISGVQTLIIVVIAIPFGIVPLVRQIFGAGPGGLFNRVFQDPDGSAEWIIPVAVLLVAAVVVIAVEELPKRQG